MDYLINLPAKVMEVGRGEFSCPGCRRRFQYRHVERYERVLAFLLLPIVGDKLDEFVECVNCGRAFPLDVLRSPLPEASKQMLDGLIQKLTTGEAIEEAEASLAEAGFDVSAIKQYVSAAAGIGRKRCPECKLTYRRNVVNCGRCTQQLPESDLLGKR